MSLFKITYSNILFKYDSNAVEKVDTFLDHEY